MDKVEKNVRYLENGDLSHWNQYTEVIFKDVLFKLEIPPEGLVVEMGTFRCVGFDRLCTHYGLQRCLGYDVVNYANHPRVITKDVRDLNASDNIPIALGWNDVSDWRHSPESKMAAARFLTANLLPGGIYIDEDIQQIPKTLGLAHGFEILFVSHVISIFRKLACG